jgi:hypothetical protein
MPIDHWLVPHLGAQSPVLYWIRTFYAPFTEEPAKLVPLLIPAIRRDIQPVNFVRYALAIGLGFALGEMWFVANRVAHTPQFANLPFYQFGGYVTERLMTCIFHSAFVSLSLWRLRNRFALGFAAAAAAHWLGNAPILLLSAKALGMKKVLRVAFVETWLMLYFFAAAGLLAYFAFGRVSPIRLFYRRRLCPTCHEEFDPPIFGVNVGTLRYERCPHCRRWNWTRPAPAPKDDKAIGA